MSGYARAHRGRWDHRIFKNKQEAAVWAWMTDTARWRPHSFQTRFGMVHLGRGQLLLSQRTLAEEFGLGRQQVRRLMDTMRIEGMIVEDSTHTASRAGTIVTIVNYERYQTDNRDEVASPTHADRVLQPKANPRPTQDQPTREEREKRETGEIEEESPSDSSVSEPIKPGPSLLALVSDQAKADEVGEAFRQFECLRAEFYPAGRTLTLDPDRRKKLAARLRQAGGLRGWDSAMATIRGSPFLRGETGKWPFVSITFLLNPASFRRILEGEFNDERSAAAAHRRQGVPASPIDAFSLAIAASGLG